MVNMIENNGFNYDAMDLYFFRQRHSLFKEYAADEERMQYCDDWVEWMEEEERHEYLAAQTQPLCTTPEEEPWYHGPPSLAHYTEVDLPVWRLPQNITIIATDELLKEGTIYIPKEGFCDSPYIKEFVAMIVGRDGDWLKQITEKTGIHYLWYNPNPGNFYPAPAWGSFQAWGSPDRLSKARLLLESQIDHVVKKLWLKYNKGK
jgi:hypothetical protein